MAKTQTLTDNFLTASSSKWSGYGSNPSVSSGRLSIVPTSSYPSITSVATYDFTSSYVMIQLVQAPNVGNGTSSAAMNIQVSTGNSEQILVEGTNLIFRETVGGVNSNTSITYNSTTHAWLRIRESGGTVFWDTSPDAINWTNRRSKALGIPSPTAVRVNIFAGFFGTEPAPGTALFDNFNIAVPPASIATGWSVGRISSLGGTDGGTVVSRNYLEEADWLWDAIPANPVLDVNSAAMVTSLSSTSGGAQRVASLYDYAATLVGPTGITSSTPRYAITPTNYPMWGANPFANETVPIPDGTPIPPGTDGHVSIADPTTQEIYSLWQTTHAGSTWGSTWGSTVAFQGDGRETPPQSSTATGLCRYAAVIRGSEIQAGQIPHALFFATDMASTTAFKYPAYKTDGDNAAGVPVPIPEGSRVQLDPSINVAAIANITPGEIAVARALQTYGAYCGDKGGSRMGFIFEFLNDGNPGQIYVNAGFTFDYFNMTHIPWSSLRVLNSWNGA